MDVHSQSFSLCAFEPSFNSKGKYFAETKVPAEPINIKKYVERLRKSIGNNCRFVTGYEAGSLGFSLYNALVSMDIECVILAPSTMLCPKGGKRIKTDRYLATLEQLQWKIKAFDVRIEEMSHMEEYDVRSTRMPCFLGITRNRAISILSETGDFGRFRSPASFAAYLGLVPGEKSSGAETKRTGITKAGNVHIRKELIEAAQSICRGRVGHKGKALAERQNGNPTDAVAYADKCNERLRRRYYKMINSGKNRNVAVTAIARKLACFVCGMM